VKTAASTCFSGDHVQRRLEVDIAANGGIRAGGEK
jgi:hypothetical protein